MGQAAAQGCQSVKWMIDGRYLYFARRGTVAFAYVAVSDIAGQRHWMRYRSGLAGPEPEKRTYDKDRRWQSGQPPAASEMP